MPGKQTPVEGVISADEMYTRKELRFRLGISNTSIAELHANGLTPAELSRKHLYFGDEVIAYCRALRDRQRVQPEVAIQ